MGHHFSSIAGAGPITGPIGAAMFGWLPVTLWVLVGGIFFGGVHDFGALFASVRHNGQSIGEIISANMSKRAKQLFIIFSYLTLILVVAVFAAIVASTFGATIENGAVNMEKSAVKASVAMVSMLFIVAAVIFGLIVYRFHVSMAVSTVMAIGAIVLCMGIGMNFHPIYFSQTTWMWLIGLYITIASVTPVCSFNVSVNGRSGYSEIDCSLGNCEKWLVFDSFNRLFINLLLHELIVSFDCFVTLLLFIKSVGALFGTTCCCCFLGDKLFTAPSANSLNFQVTAHFNSSLFLRYYCKFP